VRKIVFAVMMFFMVVAVAQEMSSISASSAGISVSTVPTPVMIAAGIPPVVVTAVVPGWVDPILNSLAGMPKIGPVVAKILSWMGTLAAVLTALTSLLMFLSGLLGQLNKIKELEVVTKALEFINKATPYVAYLSMFNVSRTAGLPLAMHVIPENKKV
jgi:hypothetical protein